jgi:hypothetical protein
MIVCQCNVISGADIEEAIADLLNQDPWRLIVPVQVYHALGQRGRCCGCFPGVVDIIVKVTEGYHARLATPQAEVVSFIERLRKEHDRIESERSASLLRINGPIAA